VFNRIINIASDPKQLSLVKNKNLIELFSSLNEVDTKLIEDFTRIIKRAMAEHEDGFVVDFVLSKNANSKFKYASAVGFVKFNLYQDIVQALESREYKLYKQPVRKRDLENLKAIHEHIFHGNLLEDYHEETENKRFRYLTILLKTSYLVASVVNKYIGLINSDLKLKGEDRIEPLNTDWVDIIQQVYELDKEIRLIPNQDEFTEGKPHNNEEVIRPSRLKLDEEDLKNVQINTPVQQQQVNTPIQPVQQPIYTPTQPIAQPQLQQPMAQPAPVQQQPLDPLQVLKQASMQPQGMYQQPMPIQQPMPMPAYQQQAPVPLWMQREIMSANAPQPGMMNQMPMQQPMGYPQYPNPYMQTPNGAMPYNPNQGMMPMYPYMQQPRYTAG
jgi:hypothetical protein